ncbi:dihydrolipoyl dehydrogenase [Candidatus Ishikawella capsulata]|uniref:Dihydrolipoyl dehydrogenase n=1 Tax=Candidatus Ishikawaella capsulata Mpkobe TaxID=476281 RepID=C5WD31_9ENTR|nr:dihydrolipoyl dehydrogenase [Candidatus Ishikawaella capsulata]BAH83237.1 dihydrolipoamide dehydrogenase [Candidatus Ishikawaella capsulata Mpkobe]
MKKEINTQVLVLGAGPAGYSAAFRCADLNLHTVIVDRYNKMGGVCLNVGCIPSKVLLHIADGIHQVKTLESHGVIFGKPSIDINKIRLWKDSVINRLTVGLESMAKQRNVEFINGFGKFKNSNSLLVHDGNNENIVHFENAIIATGSHSSPLSFIPYGHPSIWNSTDALDLKNIPKRMLVIGGGIIGLEIATIYQSLGSQIDIVEIFDQIIPVADKDIIKVFHKSVSKKFNIRLETKIDEIKPISNGISVVLKNKNNAREVQLYDVVLVCVGRSPNTMNLDIEKIGVKVNNSGFINVDKKMRTNIYNIFAIGDVVGQPMLAHKGIHEGHIAAEVIAGKKHIFDPIVIPSIAYTNPEVAWVGLTEKEAISKGINFKKAIFPWSASGRAIASDCADGITKLIFDTDSHRIIGGAVVGTHGGELLGEIALAIEMGCDAEDIALTIHAHPTLHESIGLAAEIFEGTITDLLNLK